jgi:hypothetical protein
MSSSGARFGLKSGVWLWSLYSNVGVVYRVAFGGLSFLGRISWEESLLLTIPRGVVTENHMCWMVPISDESAEPKIKLVT